MVIIEKEYSWIDYFAVSGAHLLESISQKMNEWVRYIIYDYPTSVKHSRLTDEKMKQHALCAGILVMNDQLLETEDGTHYRIQTYKVGRDKKLEPGDMLYHERYIRKAAGSCFVRNKQTITTAYHVVDAAGGGMDTFIQNYSVVFGLTADMNMNDYVLLPKENVVRLESVVASDTREDADYVDFKVKDELPAFVHIPEMYNGELEQGQEIYIAGYPLKSSLTVSLNASIYALHDRYFMTHADIFEYNSGSPVFLAQNNQLIGFVKGSNEKDFIPLGENGYMQTHIKPSAESKGKKIILLHTN